MIRLHVPTRSIVMPTEMYPLGEEWPTQRLRLSGREYVAVPCLREVCADLNNAGLWPPGPIQLDYAWAGHYTPSRAQKITSDALTWHTRIFCFNEIGTGKTLATLWAADYLTQLGEITSVLVVSTLSTLRSVWEQEIFTHLKQRVARLHGSRVDRLARLRSDARFQVINHDGVATIAEELHRRVKEQKIKLVIVDEGAEYANAQTQKYKALKWVLDAHPDLRVWWLTGSPMPHSPTDLWAQCRVICPLGVPLYFSHFRDRVMRQASDHVWVPRVGWQDTARESARPVVRFSRAASFDLPPTTTTTVEVGMSEEQGKAYKSMATALTAEFETTKITAVNEGVALSKLIQITCGWVYDSAGEIHEIDANKKLSELDRLISEANNIAIVFAPFRSALDNLVRFLTAKGRRVRKFDGAIPAKERARIVEGFASGLVDVIVGHPKAMAHGLTLVRSSVIIWYGPPQSYRVYEQACGRIVRPGQAQPTTIIHLQCSVAEDKIYKKFQGKKEAQGLLLEILQSAKGG